MIRDMDFLDLAVLTFRLIVMAIVVVSLLSINFAISRCADAMNETNRISVGIENGDPVPLGQGFHKADPPKEL